MKTSLKVLFAFILFALIIISYGGGAIYVTQLIEGFLSKHFGFVKNSYSAILTFVLLFILVAVLLSLLVLLFNTKFRPAVVFISFKHIHQDKAIALEKALQKEGFKTQRLPFSSKYKHDEVVSQVRIKLQQSDVLVTIPDAENASFVDSELLAASVLKIPIVLIKYQDKQSQPGTLLLGYPVFDYHCLKQNKFRPLFRFLLFASRNYKDYFNQVKRNFSQLFELYTLAALGVLLFIFLGIKFIGQLLHWIILKIFDFNFTFLLSGDYDLIQPVIAMLIMGYTVYVIGNSFYTLNVARQVTITGKDSFKSFEKEFSFLKKDKEMMQCITVNSLEAKGNK